MASNLVLESGVGSICDVIELEVFHLAFGSEVFPAHAVNVAAPVPRVHRAATQMAAMGLWRPSIGPDGPGPITESSCSDCLGCKDCFPGLSG